MKTLLETKSFDIVADECAVIIPNNQPKGNSIVAVSGCVIYKDTKLSSKMYYFNVTKHKFPYRGLMEYIIKQEKLNIAK